MIIFLFFFFFSSRRRHTRLQGDWSSDVCSSDLDKKDEPRVSIRARVCSQSIEAAGADRVVMLDLHAPQIQGFFGIPVDDLYALPVLVEAIQALGLTDLVVV